MSGNQKGSAAESKLKQSGMSVKSAQFPDASMKCKGGSVNDEATRSSVAKTPRSIGERTA